MCKLDLGMRLAEDLRRGLLVAPCGTDVDGHLVQVVRNYLSCHKRNPFPKLIKVSLCGDRPDGDRAPRSGAEGRRPICEAGARGVGAASDGGGSRRSLSRPAF